MRALVLLVLAGACLNAASAAAAQSRVNGALVVADPDAGVYHVPACPKAKPLKNPLLLSPSQAEARKLKPHECQQAVAGSQGAAPSQQLVWVDLKAKRYHLAGCSLVGLPRAQMRLDQAAAKYKPCNACKPFAPK
jgi:hypothetical protein